MSTFLSGAGMDNSSIVLFGTGRDVHPPSSLGQVLSPSSLYLVEMSVNLLLWSRWACSSTFLSGAGRDAHVHSLFSPG